MLSTTIVVPCYNEADRLDGEQFLGFLATRPHLRFLFVNDGSTDETQAMIEALASRSAQADSLSLPRNKGKAEAVRQGLRTALEEEGDLVGFWDADLATPLEAIDEFVAVMEARENVEIALGSRVKLLGRTIERDNRRHYFGRVSATVASMILRLPVYDTQCGAKVFRRTPLLSEILAEPFLSRWIFDVEILARWVGLRSPEEAEACIIEIPLMEWRGIGGSKLSILDFLSAPVDLIRLQAHYGRHLR